MKKISIALLAFGLMACESKFTEKEPTGYTPNTDSKKEYTLRSQDILERLTKAEDVLKTLKTVLQKMPTMDGGKVGVSDLIIEVLDSVKASKSEKTSAGYLSDGEVYLNTPGLSKDCREVTTRSTYSHTKEKVEHTLSVKTCKTKGEFVKIADLVVSDDSEVTVSVETDLRDVMPDVDLEQFLSVQNCKLKKDGEKVAEIHCKASELPINEYEVIRFGAISYVEARDPVFVADGTFVKQGKDNLVFTVEIDRNFNSTFRKLEKQTAAPETTP